MKHSRSILALLLTIAAVAPAAADDRFDDSVRAVAAAGNPLKTAEDSGFAVRDGRVQVVAVVAGGATPGLEAWLRSRGAVFVLSVRNRVQAFVPPGLLRELERRPGVVAVERPLYAELPEPAPPAAARKQTTLAVTSEGLAVMNAAAWHAEGFTGAGVKVGVIDLQFGGWQGLRGVELPPAGLTTYQPFGGANVVAAEVHGTACAEIVHDIAPDAELFLAHIRTLTDFFAALDWLAAQGADVVTMSVGWFGTGPGDGTGQSADELAVFLAATDAVFMTSAGNERRSHWQGASTDGNGNDWVDFSPGDDLNELSSTMSAGDRVAVDLVWNDWASPTTDYSLHLFNLDGPEPVEVAVSDRPQSGQGWQTPHEQISFTAPDGGRFGVRVSRSGVTGTNDMELFSLDSDLIDRVGDGSITLPADVGDVVAVAAIDYSAPYGVRSFSSAGPANGPGGSIAGGVTKPDLSGYDGVSTVSYGTRNFFGTSAASPHAAGAAAVVRGAEPGFDSSETRAFLETRAFDLGSGGKDNDYGWGRVFLGQTPGSDCTFSISPTSAAVAAAGGGGIIQLTATEGCPWSTASQADWIEVAPPSGSGSGVVGYTVDANPGPPRTGQLVIAGLVFTVNQAGAACSFTLSPAYQSFPETGGDGTFAVQTDAGCSWTASSADSWITVDSGAGSGSGSVDFTVAANDDAAQRTGAINVADQAFTVVQAGRPVEMTYVVAGIAETEGLAGTRWKSDLALLNPGTAAVEVDLTYRHGSGQAGSSLMLNPGEIAELVNVAADTFGVPDSAGAVEIETDGELIITARTYNDTPAGTFGQFLPGVSFADGSAGGEEAILSQLVSNDDFRTNIGFVNSGAVGGTAVIRLFNGGGEAVGNALSTYVPPLGWVQRNRVFRAAGAGDCSGCYAKIEVQGGGAIWSYASVVDETSGDPTTIPMRPAAGAPVSGGDRYLVAGIAETDGANQTRWKSNLAVLNLSGQGVTADLTYRHSGASEAATVTLADGELTEFADIAAGLFGAPGSAGAVEVGADGPLLVTARTFNQSSDGTFGQYLPGLDVSAAMIPGDAGFLSQIKSTESFRTNIGFTNYGDGECTVRVSLNDEAGVKKGQLYAAVPAGGWTQVNRVFEVSGVGGCPLGYAIVEVLTGGCEVWAYASVVDNGSGDPTTVPVVIR